MLDLIELYEKLPIAFFPSTLQFPSICDDIKWIKRENAEEKEERKLMVFWYINDIWKESARIFCYLIFIQQFFSLFVKWKSEWNTSFDSERWDGNNVRTFFISLLWRVSSSLFSLEVLLDFYEGNILNLKVFWEFWKRIRTYSKTSSYVDTKFWCVM